MNAAPMADLLEHLELPQCECLNEASDHTLRHCVEQGARDQPTLFLQSDTDEELLITLRFRQPCRVAALGIEGPADKAPKQLRLFVNKIGLDFDAARNESPTQVVDVPEAAAAGAAPVELRYVLFQNVQTLTIFVPENHGGGEETVISKLTLLGAPIVHEGAKRSKEEQEAARKADWLGKGVA